MSVSELAFIAALMTGIWTHPYLTLSIALIALLALILVVRLIWQTLRQVFSGRWVPSRFSPGSAHK